MELMQRMDESKSASNPVVLDAAVRQIGNDFVIGARALEMSAMNTCPVPLKQPAPRNELIQCYIKRNKATSTYHLFLGLDSEKGKFLLSARKIRRLTCAEIIISSDAEDISQNSVSYMGKLRSNFLEFKFAIYDNRLPYSGAVASRDSSSRGFYGRKVLPNVPYGSYDIAQVAYEVNMLKSQGTRRLRYTMHSLPFSVLESDNVVPSYSDIPRSLEDTFSGKEPPLILKNKAPKWNELIQGWCLNFQGRVTVASVKNFQMIAAPEEPADKSGLKSSQALWSVKPDEIILQFGKVSENLFTMDYRYPLSAFQAFGICLSSFGPVLPCDM